MKQRLIKGITFLLLACGLTNVSIANEAPPEVSKTSVWHAVHPDGREAYIAGSMHLLPNHALPLPRQYAASLAKVDTVYFETDLQQAYTPKFLRKVRQLGRYTKPNTLQAAVGKEMYGRVINHAEQIGYPVGKINQTKPWQLAVGFQLLAMQHARYYAVNGVDYRLLTQAQEQGKAVRGLEPPLLPFLVLAKLPKEEQKTLLGSALTEQGEANALLDKLYAAWRAGDAIAVQQAINDNMQGFEAMQRGLLQVRNNNWLVRLESDLQAHKPVLVVVGVAHLVGEKNLLSLLENIGFNITQL